MILWILVGEFVRIICAYQLTEGFFFRQGFSAEQIAKWVQDRADIQVKSIIEIFFLIISLLDSHISSTKLFGISTHCSSCHDDRWSALYQTK